MNTEAAPNDFEPKKSVLSHNTSTNAVKSNYHSYKLSMNAPKKTKTRTGSKPGSSKVALSSTKRSTKNSFLSQSVVYNTGKL
jgi:hypothetical protein